MRAIWGSTTSRWKEDLLILKLVGPRFEAFSSHVGLCQHGLPHATLFGEVISPPSKESSVLRVALATS